MSKQNNIGNNEETPDENELFPTIENAEAKHNESGAQSSSEANVHSESGSGETHHHHHYSTHSGEHSSHSTHEGHHHSRKEKKSPRSRYKGKHDSSSHHHHHHHHSHTIESEKRKEFNESCAQEFDSSDANSIPSVTKRKKRTRRVLIIIGAVLLTLIIALGTTFAVLYFNGKTAMHKNDAEPTVPDEVEATVEDDGSVTYKGARYIYNDNITNILIMGVDRDDLSKVNGYIGANGQADAVYLVSLNTETGNKTVFNISRDSMVEVDTYSETGVYISAERMQLCLAYSYGDGLKLSCENMVRSVSRLMYGIPIQSYAAIDLDAIETLCGAVGTLEVPEYDSDGVATGGMTTLTAKNVERYVRFRNTAYLDSNNNRRERQMHFIKAFTSKAIENTRANITFPLDLYNSVSGDMETNIDISGVTYLATVALSGTISYKDIAGTVTKGEKYAEFNVDESALYETVLQTFYKDTAAQ